MAKKETKKPVGFQSYGGLTEQENNKIGFDLPKVKGFNFDRQFDRELYVWQRTKDLEKKGMLGNMMKYRTTKRKGEKTTTTRSSAGVQHLQPISSGIALGMYDTGEYKTSTGKHLRYLPNISLFNEKAEGGDVLNSRIARALATRKGQSAGGTIWKRTFRTWEKDYMKQGYTNKVARRKANADPRNPVEYTTLVHGSKEWLGAFNLIDKNIQEAYKNGAKALTQGVGQLHKHDRKYLKKVLGVK